KWDFLKINPPACYHALDWGAEYRFFDDPMQEPKLVMPVIQDGNDIDRIRDVDPTAGALGDQLRVIRNLRKHFGRSLPMFETIFSPIEIAHRLMPGRSTLNEIRRKSPEKLHRLLEMVADVFGRFARLCLEAGADGIFFATKWADPDQMSWS